MGSLCSSETKTKDKRPMRLGARNDKEISPELKKARAKSIKQSVTFYL